jgi:ATP-binding cassette subfamily B (MDR/TAP) protein 1
MAKPGGRYRRLQQMQNLDAAGTENVDRVKGKQDELRWSAIRRSTKEEVVAVDQDEDEEVDNQLAAKNAKRVRMLGSQDASYFVAGGLGALLAGIVFPGWGIIFAYVRGLSRMSVDTKETYLTYLALLARFR